MQSEYLQELRKKRRAGQEYKLRWLQTARRVEADGLAVTIREAAKDHISWAPSTQQNRVYLVRRFKDMHKEGQWVAFRGREFHHEKLVGMCIYAVRTTHN